ncbi:uncharacterized protein Z520_09845 [Fonsecaea multimorphosa CBS 102226]|uniref:Uncharacterized protein n=1 Tax=Fonsecaea multimorphosa CBS 102226 TaxID=1442371 RepID=A0A0D2JVB9_9EURO|nr:uncharacterized protein Z520_09845 [Fonsecaea multimorphosa CBS 102226]KIX94459.1 hypothetical protein Z520_09845 [Fonsecaea multimorphosa CBS 102226]OAL20039.1 hypothetical protein AYO22_09189 [Fonsecaea multimorphosa]
MTSLIFGSIWLGHKGIVQHKREKQRQKNYERWEGLRDEYDEQRKINRESRSLDIQRTGSVVDYDKPILTLRDQQEANDARTSWRPQEAWEDVPERRASVEVTSGSGLRPLPTHKTGSTWDEGLPQPLRVSRRNWDDYQTPVSRSSSLRNASGPGTPRDGNSSNAPSVHKQSPRLDAPAPASTTASHAHASRSASMPAEMLQHETVEPIEHATPGGRMAELIEMSVPQQPAPYTGQAPQTYASYQPQPYLAPAPAPVARPADGSMPEWWNRS